MLGFSFLPTRVFKEMKLWLTVMPSASEGVRSVMKEGQACNLQFAIFIRLRCGFLRIENCTPDPNSQLVGLYTPVGIDVALRELTTSLTIAGSSVRRAVKLAVV